MRSSSVAAAVSAALAVGCDGGVTLTIDSDRAVPAELDVMCVGIADRDVLGGHFGRAYPLVDRLATLPQTLAVEAGSADRASAWAVGYRGGAVVAHDSAVLDFDGGATLRLDRCPRARGGAIVESPAVAAPAARAVASQGQGGVVVVAFDATAGAIVDVRGGEVAVEALAGGGADAVVAADLDADCDDDLAIARAGAVELWWRQGRAFTAGPTLAVAAAALATADVDGDGDVDLIAGDGASVVLARSDGAGGVALDPGAIATGGTVMAVAALAAGDLDGDGHADLVVGQRAQPLVALRGDPGGSGRMAAAPGVLGTVPRTVAALALADLDGDRDLDLAVALAAAGPRVLFNRGGLLEDRTDVTLPAGTPTAAALAIGDWSGDCVADVTLAADPAVALAGGDGGTLAREADLAAATAVVAADLDDDGVSDRVTVGADGARWVRR